MQLLAPGGGAKHHIHCEFWPTSRPFQEFFPSRHTLTPGPPISAFISRPALSPPPLFPPFLSNYHQKMLICVPFSSVPPFCIPTDVIPSTCTRPWESLQWWRWCVGCGAQTCWWTWLDAWRWACPVGPLWGDPGCQVDSHTGSATRQTGLSSVGRITACFVVSGSLCLCLYSVELLWKAATMNTKEIRFLTKTMTTAVFFSVWLWCDFTLPHYIPNIFSWNCWELCGHIWAYLW